MGTLEVPMEDALMERGTDAVQERGEDTEHLIKDVLTQAFPSEATESTQQTYSDDGVDLTLIRWMLSLSPLERLRTAQQYARSAQRLRNAPRKVRL